MTHPETKPTCKKHIVDYLSEDIHVSQWFSNPAHCTKCVAGALFEIVKSNKSIQNLDTLGKKYYSYYINANRKNSVQDIRKNIISPLDHIFDNCHLRYSKWCPKKRI